MISNEAIIIIFALILVIIQGTIIFRDAIKNDIPNPWLWGIIGLMNIPTSTIAYLIYRKIHFKKKNKK